MAPRINVGMTDIALASKIMWTNSDVSKFYNSSLPLLQSLQCLLAQLVTSTLSLLVAYNQCYTSAAYSLSRKCLQSNKKSRLNLFAAKE